MIRGTFAGRPAWVGQSTQLGTHPDPGEDVHNNLFSCRIRAYPRASWKSHDSLPGHSLIVNYKNPLVCACESVLVFDSKFDLTGTKCGMLR